MNINLQLFGGRGGSSGGGGTKEESGFQALASGVMEDELTERQEAQVKDYLQDFLRDTAKLKDGQYLSVDKYNDYTIGTSLEDLKKYINDFLDYDYDTGKVDPERTSEFWDYDRRVYVSYDASGEKYHNYYFESLDDFKRLSRDLKSKKIKGMVYEDGYETRVAGKGITILGPRDPGGSAYFRFEQGRLPKKSK